MILLFPPKNVDLCVTDSCLPLFFESSGSDIKTDGFTLSTCRTMVNLLDVSYRVGLSYCKAHNNINIKLIFCIN